jgi:hypothetical protein
MWPNLITPIARIPTGKRKFESSGYVPWTVIEEVLTEFAYCVRYDEVSS